MPVRIATLSRQLHKNGQRLHLAVVSRAFSQGADTKPAAAEEALREERALLKEEHAQRKAQAALPKVKAVKVVKEAKAPKVPKAPKAPKAPKEAKAEGKNKPSRAEKLTKKAANLDAAKKADKKSASKT